MEQLKVEIKKEKPNYDRLLWLADLIDNAIALFEKKTGNSFKETYPDLFDSYEQGLAADNVALLEYVEENLDLITADMISDDECVEWSSVFNYKSYGQEG